MCPFSVTVQHVPDRELGPLLTRLAEAGFSNPTITHVDAGGAQCVAGLSEGNVRSHQTCQSTVSAVADSTSMTRARPVPGGFARIPRVSRRSRAPCRLRRASDVRWLRWRMPASARRAPSARST